MMNPTPQSKTGPPPAYSQVVETGSGIPGYTQPGYGQVAHEQMGRPQQSQPGYGPQQPVPGYGQVQQAGYGLQPNTPYGAAPNPDQQQQQQFRNTQVTIRSPNAAGSSIWGSSPQSLTCKYCHRAVTTEITYRLGTCAFMVIVMSYGLCLLFLLIPGCLNSVKDKVHKCPNCKKILGYSSFSRA